MVKLISKYRFEAETRNTLLQLQKHAASTHISPNGLASYLRLLRKTLNESIANEESPVPLFQALSEIIISSDPQEVWAFDGGSMSGLKLAPRKEFPPDGYGFVGWLCPDRRDPSCMSEAPKCACIFQFASKTQLIKLYLQDGFLHYLVPSHITNN